jgi:hypothetical protein
MVLTVRLQIYLCSIRHIQLVRGQTKLNSIQLLNYLIDSSYIMSTSGAGIMQNCPIALFDFGY